MQSILFLAKHTTDSNKLTVSEVIIITVQQFTFIFFSVIQQRSLRRNQLRNTLLWLKDVLNIAHMTLDIAEHLYVETFI